MESRRPEFYTRELVVIVVVTFTFKSSDRGLEDLVLVTPPRSLGVRRSPNYDKFALPGIISLQVVL